MAGLEEIYVESEHILAPDRMTRVHGSVKLDRDLRRDLRSLDPFGDREYRRAVSEMKIDLIPKDKDGNYLEWCSDPDHVGYNEDGKDDHGWRPRGEFSEFVDRHGKKRARGCCDTCRARRERKRYKLLKEAQGQRVRAYNRAG